MPTRERDHEDANNNHVKERTREDDCKQEILNLQKQLACVTEERDKLKEDYKQEIFNLQQQLTLVTQERDKLKMNHTQQAALNSQLISQISELRKLALAMQEIPQRLSESIRNCKDIHQPKNLRKKAVEKSSDDQETLDDPIAETLCQQRFVLAKRTVNLSELQYELMVEIARRLERIEDFTCLRSVSRSFHLLVKDEYFEGLRFRKSLPYLMLPPVVNEDIPRRQFYSLIEGESIVASLEVPGFKTITKMCYESLGWLLTVEVDGSMTLLDPFSNTEEIPLPHLHTFPGVEGLTCDKRFVMKKMVLSSRPNETSDFIMMIIIGNYAHLAFWRLGDKTWNKIDDRRGRFRDVVYGGGEQFYAISNLGVIWVINLSAGHAECRIIIDCHQPLGVLLGQGQYIVKTIYGSVLAIRRSMEKKFGLTSIFQVYDIDIVTGQWKEIYSLGNMAIFLGRNSSIAVDATASASNGGVIKANHIYFTDDFEEAQHIYFYKGADQWRSFSGGSRFAKGCSVDCGAFNFETGDIEPIYPVEPLLSYVCPAMWITPNLCS